MRRTLIFLSMVVISGCGATSTTSQSTETPATSVAPATTASASVTGAVLTVATKGSAGSVLSNAAGFSLYYFTPDAAGTPTCVAACAGTWPAQPAASAAASPPGPAVTGRIGSAPRAGGAMQMTYNGWPLYTYVQDKAPDDAYGEGVGGVWHAMHPDTAGPAPAPASSPASVSTPRPGY
jgi:predicted lipoprotein with Yx(FWY)xxD motif